MNSLLKLCIPTFVFGWHALLTAQESGLGRFSSTDISTEQISDHFPDQAVQGAIVGWGEQVVGVDLSQGIVSACRRPCS
jgi:hypothetical protein